MDSSGFRLIYAQASPFARKARIVIREKGLTGEIAESEVNPYQDPAELTQANPLAQVPALVRQSGPALVDSTLICEFLDGLGEGPPLAPSGADPWAGRNIESLCDGLLEAAVKLRQETIRPASEQSPSWKARWTAAIERTLDRLEHDLAETPVSAELDLSAIAIGCAVQYLDFRHPQIDWRGGRPHLCARSDGLSKRASFIETAPQ